LGPKQFNLGALNCILVFQCVFDQCFEKATSKAHSIMTDLPASRPKTIEAPHKELPFVVAFAALFMGALAMGISPVFVRFSEIGPFASAFWRVALALPALYVWALMDAKRANISLRSSLKINRAIVLTGVFFAGDLFFWHLAIMNTNIANATLLACLAPIWVVLLASTFIGEKIARGTIPGLAVCLAGAFLLVGSSFQVNPQQAIGDIYGLITSIFFGLYFLAVRVARRTHTAGALIFLSTIITAAILLAVTLISGQGLIPDTLQGASALAALGLISHTGGQGLLAVALGSLSAMFSSLVIFIEAIAAAIFGWMLLNEPLSLAQIGGGALILSGVWIARPKTGASSPSSS
jgi:drug/metabolite transporter (DMT)-like permease